MTRLTATCVVAACVLLMVARPAGAQFLDPGRAWRTAETANFRIHFEADARSVAQRVGDIVERAHALVTRELDWSPRDKVDVVLYSGVDLPNGFATPLPFNRSGIFLTAPTDGELLDRSQWLELVILHELIHVIHLDKVAGAPAGVRGVFGRIPWTFPNALQPTWLVEGLAVHGESRADNGSGRLFGPHFEAQLRDERRRGFITLAELNADGRRGPLNRNYLYGAYFFEYLTRTYGRDAAARHVGWYSRQLLPFRVRNSTREVTKEQIDTVWSGFIADLTRQVDARSASLAAAPERVGQAFAAPWWALDALAVTPNGDVYAVANDGINAPALLRYRSGSARAERLAAVHPFARIDVRADGAVLVAQPEFCGGYEVLYDLYRVTHAGPLSSGLQRLTTCGRFLRAAWAGAGGVGGADDKVVGIRNDREGATRVVLLDTQTGAERTLVAAEAARQWIDIAATSDAAVAIGKRAGSFDLVRIDLASGALAQLATGTDPKTDIHTAADGAILFIGSAGGVPNVWRLAGDGLTRLTHAHSMVTRLGGVAGDGTLVFSTLEHGKAQLRLMKPDAVLETRAVAPDPAAVAPVLLPPAAQPVTLASERDYNPLPSLAPRAWWPVFFSDRGALGVGVSVFGADALGVHSYLLSPYVEVTQGELLGQAEYAWRNRHFVSLERELKVRRWTGDRGNEDPVEYERVGRAQWVSLARAVRLQRSAALGLGAALSRRDGVVVDGPATREEDERLAAVIALYDSRGGGVLSDGPSRGQQAQLFYETHRPLSNAARGLYSGKVVRLLWDGYLPLGRSVLAGHWSEGRGQVGKTEPFQLGGDFSGLETLAPQLNERDISLRGYNRGEPRLRAASARRLSVEWRTPIADIDRHAMVPPFGVNRVSGTVFYETGGVWDRGGSPDRWFRAAGVEAIGEFKFGYLIPFQLRVGVARGLDAPGDTRAYLHAGRSF